MKIGEENNLNNSNPITFFDLKNIRYVWDDEKEDWYFSVIDLISIFTDCTNPDVYISELIANDESLKSIWDSNGVSVLMTGADGKKQEIQTVNIYYLFRIIQSIPSKKAEPLKKNLAELGAERFNQIQNPELSIKQGLQDYLRLGYSEDWINMRLKSIEIKNELTDQWKLHKVESSFQHADLLDVICKTWSGKSVKEYKKFKGLKKESLQDNMTNIEIVLNMLAEISASSITESKNPQTYEENVQCAQDGGSVAAVARRSLEKELGKSVISPLNAKDYFLDQRKIKKSELYRPVRNFILGTGLQFGFCNEAKRVYYQNSYFIIDQIYYHIPTRRLILLKICRKKLNLTELEKFKEQIIFYNTQDKYAHENDAIGMMFIINKKQIRIEYVIPDLLGKEVEEIGLPSSEILDSYLLKSLTDLQMN